MGIVLVKGTVHLYCLACFRQLQLCKIFYFPHVCIKNKIKKFNLKKSKKIKRLVFLLIQCLVVPIVHNSVKPVLNWETVCSPNILRSSTNYDSFLN